MNLIIKTDKFNTEFELKYNESYIRDFLTQLKFLFDERPLKTKNNHLIDLMTLFKEYSDYLITRQLIFDCKDIQNENIQFTDIFIYLLKRIREINEFSFSFS